MYQPFQFLNNGALSLSGDCIKLFTGTAKPAGKNNYKAQYQSY